MAVVSQPPGRGVAQPGSAPAWGAGGRWFKSSRPDHFHSRRRFPGGGLGELEPLDTDARLAGHYRLDAARAHFHEMAGRFEVAHSCYLSAAGKTASIPERDYLTTKAARIAEALAKAGTPIRPPGPE